MARELTINIWCDLCQAYDETKVEAKEMPPMQIGNHRPRVLALCKEHEVDFFDKVLEAVELGTSTEVLARNAGPRPVGRPPTQQPKADGILCPVADCGVPLANTSSLRGHIRGKHDTTLDKLLAAGHVLLDTNGDIFDYNARASANTPPKVLRTECDQPGCGQVYEYPESQRPAQAMGVHRRMKHGITADGTVVEEATAKGQQAVVAAKKASTKPTKKAVNA